MLRSNMVLIVALSYVRSNSRVVVSCRESRGRDRSMLRVTLAKPLVKTLIKS